MNEIEINNPKISLLNCVGTPLNYPGNKMLAITDLGVNIHLAKQDTTTTASLMLSNEIIARLPDGITMDLSQISTLQLPGLSNQARQIHMFPEIKTSALMLRGVLFDDGCNIPLEKQDISVKKNGQEIMKGTRNKQTGMW